MTSARDVILSAIVAHLERIGHPLEPIVQDVVMTDAILAALDAAGFTPPLPKEPTANMLVEGNLAYARHGTASEIYKAMLKATKETT